jgi:hypothetical protein
MIERNRLELEATQQMQTYLRGYLGRKVASHKRQCLSSALFIQCKQRQAVARQQLKMKRDIRFASFLLGRTCYLTYWVYLTLSLPPLCL